MRNIIFTLFFVTAALTAGSAVSADEKAAAKAATPTAATKTDALWAKRCETEGEKKGQCELFQRLVVKETGKRVVEFAVGYPEKKEEARGVIVLPLGILLTEGVKMQIDGGQSFTFKPRYCGPEGCFAFVNMNKQMLDIMRKGKEASLTFQTVQGQNLTVKMSLEGFGKTLKEIS